jgi:hypothetical protein
MRTDPTQPHHGPQRKPPRVKVGSVGQKVFLAGAGKRRTASEKQTTVLAPGRDKAMASLRAHRNAQDQAELPPRGHRLPQRPARYSLGGRYFVPGLAFSLWWWEFSIIPLLGLPTGVATAGANAFVMATIV